jgi:hypothetical protein
MSDKACKNTLDDATQNDQLASSTQRGLRPRAILTGASYGRLVEVCDAFHIPRTKAFAYAKAGLLKTFLLNRQRMVEVKSVETLPERLQAMQECGDEK